MATMKCKACNRVYNYRNSELCPKCGAYNRPPHRMQVEFDENGNAALSADKGNTRPTYTTTETKTSYAESIRKVRDTLVENDIVDSKTLDTLGEQLNKWGGRLERWWRSNSGVNRHVTKDSPLRDRKQGKSGGKAAVIIAAVGVLVSLLGTILESCESNRVHIAPAPDVSIATEQVAPADRYWSAEDRKMILDAYAVSEEMPMGEVFEWQDVKMWLGGWELSGGSSDNFMVVSVNCGDVFPEERLDDCFLLWVDWDGTEWVYNPTKFQNGALIFNYLHTTSMPEDTLCWLIFNDYDENDNWIGTTAVSLVEHDLYWNSATQDFASTEVWPEEKRKALLESYGVTQTYNMGSTFIWEGQHVAVNGWEVNENNGDRFMEVSVDVDDEYVEDVLNKWYLLWLDENGDQWSYLPSAYRDGELVFTDLHTTIIDESTPIWLLCEQYEQYDAVRQYISTTAVTLN